MTAIDTSLIPVRVFHVRRRRYGADRWLILRNSFYLLDETADRLWLACDGKRTIGDIASMLVTQQRLSLGDALAATVYGLEYFRHQGFLSYKVDQIARESNPEPTD